MAEKDGREEGQDRQNQNHMWGLVYQIWPAAQDVRGEGTSLLLGAHLISVDGIASNKERVSYG
jgi:hypothetical protein